MSVFHEQTEDQLIHFDGIKHLDQDLIDDSIRGIMFSVTVTHMNRLVLMLIWLKRIVLLKISFVVYCA